MHLLHILPTKRPLGTNNSHRHVWHCLADVVSKLRRNQEGVFRGDRDLCFRFQKVATVAEDFWRLSQTGKGHHLRCTRWFLTRNRCRVLGEHRIFFIVAALLLHDIRFELDPLHIIKIGELLFDLAAAHSMFGSGCHTVTFTFRILFVRSCACGCAGWLPPRCQAHLCRASAT